MFTLCIWFGNSQNPWAFVYDTADKAETQLLQYSNGDKPLLDFHDDYGQRLLVKREHIQGLLIDDMKKSAAGKIEISLHGARTQAAYNTRIQADPMLRLNGAPVIQPMGLGPGLRGN